MFETALRTAVSAVGDAYIYNASYIFMHTGVPAARETDTKRILYGEKYADKEKWL
jgi:hypothetical protein